MKKDEFIQQYVAAFMATWAANGLVRPRPSVEGKAPRHDYFEMYPAKDALQMAEEAWEKLQVVITG